MIYYTLLLFLLSASKMQVQLMFNIETDLDILQTSVKVRGCVTNLGFPRFIGSLHRRNWEQHSRHRHLRGLAHTDSAGVEWSDVSINRPAQQRTCQRSAFFFGGGWFLTGNKSSDSSFLDTTFVACPRHFHHETDSWRLGSTVSTVLSLFHETSLPYTDMQLSQQIRTFLRLERQLGKWLGGWRAAVASDSHHWRLFSISEQISAAWQYGLC